ncbi:hypothetical protein ACI797_04560 [Geodermatophilus sp. SYSU D00691]
MDDDGAVRRRPRGGLLGAALALLLVFAAVRLTAAEPGPPTPPETAGTGLLDLPTRGSLAGDDGWLAALTAARALADLPPDRHVAYAGDAAGVRLALVLAGAPSRPTAVWLTGPAGSGPDGMVLAAGPVPVGPREPLALWDVPRGAGRGGLLLVVALPGDQVELLTGRVVDAAGQETRLRTTLPLHDGVAVATAEPPAAPADGDFTAGRLVVTRGATPLTVAPLLSARGAAAATAPIDPADPRGLRATVDEAQLQAVLHEMVGAYGLLPERVSPALLAAGPVGDERSRAVLVGVTLPSGATVAWLSVAATAPDAVPRVVSTRPAAAGTALLDRVVAVPAGWAVSRIPLPPGDGPPGWLVVSGPRGGTAAEALSAGGNVLAAFPLAGGSGTAQVPPGTSAVRVVDDIGAFVAGSRLARVAG